MKPHLLVRLTLFMDSDTTTVLVSQCVLSSVVLILVKIIGGEWFNFPVMILSAFLSGFVSGCPCFFVVRSDTDG